MKTETTSTFSFVPEDYYVKNSYVGGYRLGGEFGLQINFTHKPNWFHRTMMKLCLGWEWVTLNTEEK